MADLFEIIPREPKRGRTGRGRPDIAGKYTALQGEFLSSSYGYYATHFISKIAAEAAAHAPQVEVLSIHKLLRQLVRKYLLCDLELVFLGHVAGQLEWAFSKPFYKQRCQVVKAASEQLHKGIELLNFFLHLCASFVKNYIGQLDQAAAISDFLGAEMPGWEEAYEEWLRTLPSELFKLSPRTVNTLFRSYTRDCLKAVHSKNYNSMVDRVLELSTTYSMIPGEVKHKKKKTPEIYEDSSSGRKIIKRNIVTEGIASNISKRQESSIIDPPIESRLSSNFFDPKPAVPEPREVKESAPKRGLLKLKTKNQQVSSHVGEFYSKKQYDLPGGREQFRPESTIGFQNSVPSLLDFNNRSSVYEAIPYTLRNNSNLSNFWK